MAKTRQQKETEVKSLLAKVKTSKGGVFVSYEGLSVADLTNLRKELRAVGISFTMIKKRLLKLVLAQAKIATASLDLKDKNISVALSAVDEVMPARLISQYAQNHEGVELRGGILEKTLLDEDQVKALANIPGREELLAKLVGSLQSPVSGLVGVLSANLRQFVYVLNAIRETKSE